MPRKNKKVKTIKEKKQIQEKVEISKGVINELSIEENPKSAEQEKDEKDLFQTKVDALVRAINTPDGKKLSLKTKVYNNTCHIYQGIFNNVWGRINPNGTHTIYRHALTNMLKKNPETKELF